jgi:hypothetical protein
VAVTSPPSSFADGPLDAASTLRIDTLLQLANDPTASAEELRIGLRQVVPYVLDSGEVNVAMQRAVRSLIWHIRLLIVVCSGVLGWVVCATWPH